MKHHNYGENWWCKWLSQWKEISPHGAIIVITALYNEALYNESKTSAYIQLCAGGRGGGGRSLVLKWGRGGGAPPHLQIQYTVFLPKDTVGLGTTDKRRLKKSPSPHEVRWGRRMDAHTLLSYCRQVASRMAYLSNKAFVHRDLAARNILVSEDEICKVCRFSITRSTPVLVMCGVMELSCTRYGVWDTNHLPTIKTDCFNRVLTLISLNNRWSSW